MNPLAKQLPKTPPGTEVEAATLSQRLSQARHDLRNPLSGILGFSEMLIEEARDAHNDRWARDFEWINQAASEILKAINEHTNIDALASDTESLHKLHGTIAQLSPKIAETAELVAEQISASDPETFSEDLRRIANSARQIPELAARLLPPSIGEEIQPRRQGLAVDDIGLQHVVSTPTEGTHLARQPEIPAHGTAYAEVSEPARASHSGALLIVDDSESNRILLSRTLMRQGYQVTTANEGSQALDLLHSQQFDAVLLDIVMPKLDGYEVLTQMKQDEQLRHIPVIMISALDDLTSLVRCIEGGADDYLTKPFDPVLLRARIGACLEKKRFHDKEQALLRRLQEEQTKSETLLLNILPRAIADRLKQGENTIVDSFADVSVLFADLVGFSSLFNEMSPGRVVHLLDEIFSAFDLLAQERGLEKIKTIGDAYMVVGGLPVPLPGHAEEIAELALHMQHHMQEFNANYDTHMKLRIGIDTGPCVAGIIGRNKFIYDLWGDSVNIASRMESQGEPDCIQVTRATRDRLHDNYHFEERGVLDIKGQGAMPVYWLSGRR